MHTLCAFSAGRLHPKDEALLEEEVAEQPKSKRCVCVCVVCVSVPQFVWSVSSVLEWDL